MELFHIIDDACVILRSRGVFKQAKVYRRDGVLYAGHAGGFITLRKNGGTSVPSISWIDTDAPFKIEGIGPLQYAGAL